MIELTPLDVRKKRGDFRRTMRGFDPQEVDAFLELVSERMESLVKENMTLKERSARLADQVSQQQVREGAVQDALVTAQELRKDISGQAQREAELIKREAEAEIERMLLDAENRADSLQSAMAELERRRRRFLKGYRQMLERELDSVEVEASRHPLEDRPLELELPGGAAALIESTQAAESSAASGDAEPGETPGVDTVVIDAAGDDTPVDESTSVEAATGDAGAVSVGDLAPDASEPAPTEESSELEGQIDEWGSVRPRLRTEANTDPRMDGDAY